MLNSSIGLSQPETGIHSFLPLPEILPFVNFVMNNQHCINMSFRGNFISESHVAQKYAG